MEFQCQRKHPIALKNLASTDPVIVAKRKKLNIVKHLVSCELWASIFVREEHSSRIPLNLVRQKSSELWSPKADRRKSELKIALLLETCLHDSDNIRQRLIYHCEQKRVLWRPDIRRGTCGFPAEKVNVFWKRRTNTEPDRAAYDLSGLDYWISLGSKNTVLLIQIFFGSQNWGKKVHASKVAALGRCRMWTFTFLSLCTKMTWARGCSFVMEGGPTQEIHGFVIPD